MMIVGRRERGVLGLSQVLIGARCVVLEWVEVLELAHVKRSCTHTTSMPF